MQILINIDEDTYNDIKKGKIYSSFRDVPLESVNAIANGTPLPDIFDLEGLKSDMKALNCGYPYGLDYLLDCLKKRLGITIIEVDTKSEDEVDIAIANGTPLDEKELKLKRWIEKDIKMLNEIIESGWLISDLEKCPAIDACEDAITALKQYPVLDKVRAEIEQLTSRYSISKERGGMGQVEWSDRLIKESDVLQVIDKYRGNVDEI